MNTILIALLLLTNILFYLILFDVILSWLNLLGVKWRPRFLAEILDPMYKTVKKIIPTIFGPFEFAPFIVMLILVLLQQLVFVASPEIIEYYNDLLNF